MAESQLKREYVELVIEVLSAKPDIMIGNMTGNDVANQIIKAAKTLQEYIEGK